MRGGNRGEVTPSSFGRERRLELFPESFDILASFLGMALKRLTLLRLCEADGTGAQSCGYCSERYSDFSTQPPL